MKIMKYKLAPKHEAAILTANAAAQAAGLPDYGKLMMLLVRLTKAGEAPVPDRKKLTALHAEVHHTLEPLRAGLTHYCSPAAPGQEQA